MESSSSSSSSSISKKMVRRAIRMVVMAVGAGILMMWIMLPTKTFRQNWLLTIRRELNHSTYFGRQGTNLVIFTVPVLFIAAMGCIYLHLTRDTRGLYGHRKDNKVKALMMNNLKRPVLVRGPLGIVSGMELSFFLMFIVLLVWSLWLYLYNNFARITPASAAKNGVHVWQAKLSTTALYMGIVGNVALSFLFYPVTRGSSVLPLVGLTSEGSIKYHMCLGHIVMILFTAHGFGFIFYWILTNKLKSMIEWDFTEESNVAGELSLLTGLVLWLTTFPRIRRKAFEIFFYTHYLYLLFVFFFILHVGISYTFIMLPGFYLFLVDRYLRFLQSRNRVRLRSARLLIPCDTLELNFSKTPGLKYNPTSIMFVNVPSISRLQWHPFTITSSSNLQPETLSVMIKSEGSWSRKLYQMLSSSSVPNSSPAINHLEISVEGPYGPVSSHFLRHDKLVMVSGGSGITPFISIIREFIFLTSSSAELKPKTPHLLLICAFKKSSDLTMLNLLLPISGTPSDLSNLQLQIEAFVTRETTENQPAAFAQDYAAKQSQMVRTVWLKPSPRDVPVSAILGPNSWLWLGAIIVSSFLMFLILMGIITRYYIYPIDHNTNQHFSTSSKSVLHVLVMCICIAAVGSMAVLANKRGDVKQIKNLESSTSAYASVGGSPRSDSPTQCGDELESLPHHSILQCTNLHFGARPDLTRMLLDCKESSVGVLVCGPKKLRHDAAAVCSSGLTNNLHLESISFSW